ncbi:hypothetical protein FFF34_017840 [Inquilinus sp. KBS0705]|nr:hypothetical protein FFF34_017840 [Inquilinus sp. KBS0705]
MKVTLKKTLLLIILIAAATVSFAQCGKATLTGTKLTQLDNNGAVVKSKDEKTVVTITKTDITITPGNDDPKMSGKISSSICSWAKPFKTGKTVIKAKLYNDGENRENNATITIVGVAGKVTLTFESAETPGRKIEMIADTFE